MVLTNCHTVIAQYLWKWKSRFVRGSNRSSYLFLAWSKAKKALKISKYPDLINTEHGDNEHFSLKHVK